MADPDTVNQMFSGPVPGESLTLPPKNQPWEQPPQFVRMEDAMNFLFNQLLEPKFFKQLMKMLDAGMSVEAIVRTILFGGFTMGKWTVDLAMLMYKPLMLTIITLAKSAGIKHAPIVMKESLDKFLQGRFQVDDMFDTAKIKDEVQEVEPLNDAEKATGFMQRIG